MTVTTAPPLRSSTKGRRPCPWCDELLAVQQDQQARREVWSASAITHMTDCYRAHEWGGGLETCEHFRCDRTDVKPRDFGTPLGQHVVQLLCPDHWSTVPAAPAGAASGEPPPTAPRSSPPTGRVRRVSGGPEALSSPVGALVGEALAGEAQP